VRVAADRDVCIGAGVCVMSSEVVFDQDDDGIVVVSADDVPVDEQENARKAVQLCPSGALTLVD